LARVAIVTDSVADIPGEVAKALGISVIPLYIQFGLETFRDRVDMLEEEFYRKLESVRELPKTSQPSPNDFLQVYRALLNMKKEIVSIHPTAQLSGTYNTALLAREMLGNPDEIEVVDCKTGTAGQGLVVLEAARAALQGFGSGQIVELVKSMADKVRMYVALETLDYMARNGRVGRAKVFMASLLRIKPIIALLNGEIEPVDKVRGSSKIIPRLVDLCGEFVRTAKARAAITHAKAFEQARRLKSEMESRLGLTDIMVSSMCPAVVANTGPGALAVAFYEPGQPEV